MAIETTVTIVPQLLGKLTEIAGAKKISRSKLIVSLLTRLKHESWSKVMPLRQIQYQKRFSVAGYKRFHVYLDEHEYEFLLDIRRFFKHSVSSLLAYCIEKYLNNQYDCSTDNYRIQCYIFSLREVGQSITWTINWELPPEYHNSDHYYT